MKTPVARSSQRKFEELGKIIFLDGEGSAPIHAQLRNALRRVILKHFTDQERFIPENELAAALNLSAGTVRRALNDLAAEGLLVRKPATGSVVRLPEKGAVKHVAAVVPDYSSGLIAEYLDVISVRASQIGAQLHLFHTHRGERLQAVSRQIRFSSQEGGVLFLFSSPAIVPGLCEAFEDRGYCTVNIDTLVGGYSGHFVGVCNETGIERGMTHLMDMGHRRIVLLASEPEDLQNVLCRVAAFQSFCRREGLTESRVVFAHTHLWENSAEKAKEVMPSLWDGPNRPTAIFTVSDGSAFGVLQWLASRGISVPNDVSVMGFDGEKAGELLHPPLSTIRQPIEEIVEAAFRLLENRPNTPQHLFQKPRLLLRQSTGVRAVGKKTL